MEHEVGELLIGEVTGVKPYALFLTFKDGATGLLHISEISNSYIRDIEKFGSQGDEMMVKVLSIDESNGFLRVSLKQVPSEKAYSTHSNAGRKPPEAEKDSFAPLEKKLPEWKEETLKKINGEIKK